MSNTKRYWPEPHVVKRVSDAVYSQCRECGIYLDGNVYWNWRTHEFLHQSGTGHTRFTRYGYHWPTELEATS